MQVIIGFLVEATGRLSNENHEIAEKIVISYLERHLSDSKMISGIKVVPTHKEVKDKSDLWFQNKLKKCKDYEEPEIKERKLSLKEGYKEGYQEAIEDTNTPKDDTKHDLESSVCGVCNAPYGEISCKECYAFADLNKLTDRQKALIYSCLNYMKEYVPYIECAAELETLIELFDFDEE
jgi:hypothetical protein